LKRPSSIAAGLVAAGLVGGGLVTGFAQAPSTTRHGVYTAAQAGRGEAVYSTTCVGCHEGQEADGPRLMGTVFLDRWREDTLESLFTFMTTRMPGNLPGGLDEGAYVDVLAYLLQANDLPAGDTELRAEVVGRIQLVGPDGPRPLSNLTIVRAVGCLTHEAGDVWSLAKVGRLAPVRSRTIDGITPEELTVSATQPLGDQAFRLLSVTSKNASSAGHKVHVIGVLTRQGQVERINVMALESVAATCEP
jgi:mono/diheme cytochrome c family protein